MKRADGEKQQFKVNYGNLCVVALLCSPSTGVCEAESPSYIPWPMGRDCLKTRTVQYKRKIETKLTKQGRTRDVKEVRC
jgi:hypothetical protein